MLRSAAPVVVLAFVAAGALYAYSQRAPDLEVYGTLPAFELTDQKGRTVTTDDLRGTVVVANFIFTRCPTVCPTFSMKMKRLAEKLEDTGVRFVSFSVDPAYDTPEILAAFAAKFDADPERWRFLTGDPEVIKETVEDGMAIAMDEQGTLPSGAPDIVHGTHFVLIDRDGRIRGYYNSDDLERIELLAEHARGLD